MIAGLLLLGLAVGWAAIVVFKNPNGTNEAVNHSKPCGFGHFSPWRTAAPVIISLTAKSIKRRFRRACPIQRGARLNKEDDSDVAVEVPTSAFAVSQR